MPGHYWRALPAMRQNRLTRSGCRTVMLLTEPGANFNQTSRPICNNRLTFAFGRDFLMPPLSAQDVNAYDIVNVRVSRLSVSQFLCRSGKRISIFAINF